MSNSVSNWPNARKRDPEIVRTEVDAFKRIADLPAIDTGSPEQIKNRINEYLTICTAEGLTPTIQGVSLALHVHRSTFWTWSNENSKRGQICQDFKTMQAAMTEELMLAGKANVVGCLFLLKNHHNYKDQISIDTDVTPVYDRLPSADEIRKRLTAGGQINESDI